MTDRVLINARWVVPVEPAGTVLERHAVAVRSGRIEAVLPAAQAAERYADYARIELPGHALIPGLINAHTHAAMALMRGIADDLPLMRWLEQHVWPVEAKHVSAEFVKDGTLLACAEMLRGGVTCFNDMYYFPEAALEAALQAGMRAFLGLIVIEFPSAYASDPQAYLAQGLALRDRWREHPLAAFCLAPHAPYTVSDATFRKVAQLAAELELPVHVHVHETAGEVERSVAEHGVRPLERLAGLGLLGPGLIAVHAVHLTPPEIALLSRHRASVAHCPSSNLKLASGLAPVAQLLKADVNVALGTDGAASNNRLDMWAEMQTAALLAKHSAASPQALPAAQALTMATLNGARALGLAGEVGSLVEGKAADAICVDLAGLEHRPLLDPVGALVYSASRHDVTDVWIAGEHLLAERAPLRLALDEIGTAAERWGRELLAEAR